MTATGWLYVLAGAFVVVFPQGVLDMVNAISASLTPELPPLPVGEGGGGVWRILAGGHMAALAGAALFAQADIHDRKQLAVPIIVSTAAVAVLAVMFFIGSGAHFAYLGLAGTALLLSVSTWVLYYQATR